MKEWWLKWQAKWSQFNLREKQAIGIGGAVVSIFIIYQWIWTPYLNSISALRSRIVSEQKTLKWMQVANNEIRQATKSEHNSLPVSLVEQLAWLQKQIEHAGLSQYLTQLKQATSDTIAMHFQKVEFDKLVYLLITLGKGQGIAIVQLSVTAEATPGIVNADVVLKLG